MLVLGKDGRECLDCLELRLCEFMAVLIDE